MNLQPTSDCWRGFDPAVPAWFAAALGAATPVQLQAWPLIQQSRNVLIAAPTGSGKTLAAFLAVIDGLMRRAARHELAADTQVLYISPLKALSNDIRKNLEAPLQGIADEMLAQGRCAPEIQAMVRTGDTSQRERDRMRRKPPHILVTTPESLFILLGSESGRSMLSTVRTVIVDEIHALAGSKRGAHLALSLARLDALVAGPVQKIGLSATQKPLEAVARYLCADQACEIVDAGHSRARDLAMEVPGSPLTAVMATEVWGEIYARIAELARDHRTTLVFVNTRRLAERACRHLAEHLGEAAVAAHHGSLAKEHRLDAEQRLKAGQLTVLVATASLELGIDIGEVDLVCQLGSPRAINACLQRIGRSGHAVGAVPKGRLFPTTLDEAIECAALLHAVRCGELDRLQVCGAACDVLAQHLVAEVAARDWSVDALLARVRTAWPYRHLDEKTWFQVLRMLAEGYTTRRGRRGAYLHWDQVQGQVRARRGARLVALTNAGVIPDQFDYDVILMPEGFKVGTLNEDFAFETLPGDIFQLGNQSYRVLRTESGRLLAEDAQGQPPTVPFWVGEAPGRSDELSAAVSRLRKAVGLALGSGLDAATTLLQQDYELAPAAAVQLAEYLAAGQLALGAMPCHDTIVLERFFDETGDMHLVLHSSYGSRINRAWGLALRKRFCRKFNFELQAAALEDSIVLSLGVTHSFPLLEVSQYLHSASVRAVLEQALLDAPMFPLHWRWNASIALAVRRHLGSRKAPPIWQRNDAEDLMAVVFPDQIACAENLNGKREIPDHPLVRQTMEDCLYDVMDLPGLESVLQAMETGKIRVVAADLTAPSVLAQEIINARPYAFLDDGDAENRRTMAIARSQPGSLEDARAQRQLSPAAVARVREEAWPLVRSADELHDAMQIHGFLTASEGAAWPSWLQALIAQRRATRLRLGGGGILLVCAERLHELQMILGEVVLDPPIAAVAQAAAAAEPLREIVRGRLEALGPLSAAALAASLELPIAAVQQPLIALEQEGFAVRGAFENCGEQWCERRLLARIHRYSRDQKRASCKPVSPQTYQRFLLQWHGLEGERPEGGEAILRAMDKLEGYSAPAASWEQDLLPARISLFLPSQLDALCAAGKLSWARINPGSGSKGRGPIRNTPIAFAPRESLALWRALAPASAAGEASGDAARVLEKLRSHGAVFFSDLAQATGLLRAQLEDALGELVALGLINADSFAGLRALLQPVRGKPRSAPRTRRRRALFSGMQDAGRWAALPPLADAEDALEHYLWAVLARYGVISRSILAKESVRPPWRLMLRLAWRLEARGEICGGRFIDAMAGEQFALPEAQEQLTRLATTSPTGDYIRLIAADPAHLSGGVLPGPALPALGAKHPVLYRDGELLGWIHRGEPVLAPAVKLAERPAVLGALTGAAQARRRQLA